ncbi:hypothetical protein MASR1M32_29270 [Rhodobacter sp.]
MAGSCAADVEAARPGAAAPVAAAAPAPAAGAKPAAVASGMSAETVLKIYADREFTEVALDGMRRTIAARLTEAKQTIPHFYLRRDVRLDALMAFREQLNKGLEARGVKLSVNDIIIKACALALQAVPDANAVWAGDRILKLKPSDVAVAVAVEGGLFTPVLRDADKKTLSVLSAEMKDLASRAKTKKLAPHEYQGGSFAHFQPWHDGDRELRRRHQSAAWRHSGGGRRGEEAGGAGRWLGGRGDGDVDDAFGRSPGDRRGFGGRLPEGGGRGAGESDLHAGLRKAGGSPRRQWFSNHWRSPGIFSDRK